MTSVFRSGIPKDTLGEQRKIAKSALEKLDSIKNIVEERDELRRKLESSQFELSVLKQEEGLSCKGDSKQKSVTPKTQCSYDLSYLEKFENLEHDVKELLSGRLTPETNNIKREIETLRQHCSDVTYIQKENEELKLKLTLLGTSELNDVQIEGVKEILENLNQTTKEKEFFKRQNAKLKNYLKNYSPEEIEIFKHRSLLLEEVLQDRDRLSRKLEEYGDIMEEYSYLKKRNERVDELEDKLTTLLRENLSAEEDLEMVKCKLSYAEIELLNQKAEGDTLRSKITCLEHEKESLRYLCADQDRLKKENEQLQKTLKDLFFLQDEYEAMKTQMKGYDILKAERDMFKTKHESLMGLECEVDILRVQVERARAIENERNVLENQVEDLEGCISEQEREIHRLVGQIDHLVENRDAQQERTKLIMESLRNELENKSLLIKTSEKNLASLQKQLKATIEGLTSETSQLRNQNEQLCVELSESKAKNEELQTRLEVAFINSEKLGAQIRSQEEIIGTAQIEFSELKKTVDELRNKIYLKDHSINTLEGILEDHVIVSSMDTSECSAKSTKAVQSSIVMKTEGTEMKAVYETREGLNYDESCKLDLACSVCFFGEHPDLTFSQNEISKLEDQLSKANEMILFLQEQCTLCEKITAENEALHRHSHEVQKIAKEEIQELMAHLKHSMIEISHLEDSNNSLVARFGKMEFEQNQMIEIIGDFYKNSFTTEYMRHKIEECLDGSDNFKRKLKLWKNELFKFKRLSKMSEKPKTKIEYYTASEKVNVGTETDEEQTEEKKKKQTEDDNRDKNERGRKLLDRKINEGNRGISREHRSADRSKRDIKMPQNHDLLNMDCATKKLKTYQSVNVVKNNDSETTEANSKPLDKKTDEGRVGTSRRTRSVDRSKENTKLFEDYETWKKWDCIVKKIGKDPCDTAQESKRKNVLGKKLDDSYRLCTFCEKLIADNEALRERISDIQEAAKTEFEQLATSLKVPKTKKPCRSLSLQRSDLDDGHHQKLQKDLVECLKDKEDVNRRTKSVEEELLRYRDISKKRDPHQEPSDTERKLQLCLKETDELQKKIEALEKLKRQSREDMISNLVDQDDLGGRLKRRLNDVENELAIEKSLRETAEEKIKELEEKVASLITGGDTNELDLLKKQLKDLENENTDLQQKCRDLDQLLCYSESDQVRQLVDDKDNLLIEIETLRNQMSILTKNNSDLEKENISLNKEKEKFDSERDQVFLSSKHESDQIENILEDKDKQLKEIEALRNRLKELEDNISDLERENCSLKKDNELLLGSSGQSDQLRNILEDTDELLKEIETLRNQLKELTKKNSALEEENISLRNDRDKFELKSSQVLLDDESSKLRNLGDDTDKLREELGTLIKQNNELSKKMSDLEEINSSLQKNKDQLNFERDQLLNRLKKMEDNDELLRHETEKLKKEKDLADELLKAREISDEDKLMNGLIKENADLQEENSKLKDLNQKLKNEMANLSDAIKRAENEFQDLITFLKKENLLLKDKLKDQPNEIEALKDKIKSLESALEKEKSQMDQDMKDKEVLQKIIDDLKSNLIKLSKEPKIQVGDPSKELQDQIKNLTNELRKEQDRADSAETALKNQKVSDQTNQLNKEIEKLKKQLSQAEDETERLQSLLEQKLQQMNKLEKELTDAGNKNRNLTSDLDKALKDILKYQTTEIDGLNAVEAGISKSGVLQEKIDEMHLQIMDMKKENTILEKELVDEKEKNDGLSKKLYDLQDEITKYKQELLKSKNQNEKMEKDNEKLLNNLNTKSDKLKKLEDDINKYLDQIKKLEDDNSKLRRDLNDNLENLSKLTSQNNKLNYDNATLKQFREDTGKDSSILKKMYDTAQAQASELETNLKDLHDQFDKLKKIHLDLEKENSNLRNKLNDTLGENKSLQKDLAQTQKQLAELKSNLEIEEKNKKILEDKIVKALEEVKPISSLRKVNDELKKELEQLEKENDKLKEQLDRLLEKTKKVSEKKDPKDYILNLENEISRLKKEQSVCWDNLDKEKKNLENSQQEINNYKQKLTDIENINKKLNEEFNNALDKVRECSFEISKLEDENSKLKQKNAQLGSENLKFKRNLDDALTAEKVHLATIAKLKSENDQLVMKNKLLEADNADLNGKLDHISAFQKELSANENDTKNQILKVQNENENLRAQLKKLKESEIENSKKLLVSQNDNEHLKKKIGDIETENLNLKNDYANVMGDFNSSRKEIERLQELKEKLNKELTKLQGDNKKMDDEITALRVQIKTVTENFNKLKDENDKLEKNMKTLEEENENVKKKLEAAGKFTDQSDKRLLKFQEENSDLKKKIAQLEADNAQLKKDLDNSLSNAKKEAKNAADVMEKSKKLKEILDKLENENGKLKADLNKALDEAKVSKADVSKVKESDFKQNEKINNLERENSKLRGDLEKALITAEVNTKGNQELKNENVKLLDKIGSLEKEIVRLKKDLNDALEKSKQGQNDISQIQGDDAKLKQRLVKLENENSKLKSDLDASFAHTETNSKLLVQMKNENDNQRKKQRDLESEIDDLKKKLQAAQDVIKRSEAEISNFKDENGKLKQQMNNLKRDNDEITKGNKKEISKLEDDYKKLEKQIENLKHESSNLKKDLETALNNLKGKIGDNEKLEVDKKNCLTKINELEGEIENVRKQLQLIQDENLKIKGAENELLKARQKDFDGIQTIQSDANRLKQLETENEKLRERLDSLLQEKPEDVQDYEKKINELQTIQGANRLKQLEIENAKLRERLDSLLEEKPVDIQDYEKKINELQSQIEKLKKEYNDLIAAMKNQFNRDFENLLKKNELSIAGLQKTHDEYIKNLNENHDKEMSGIIDDLRTAQLTQQKLAVERDFLKDTVESQRKKSLEIKNKVQQVESIISKGRKKREEEKKKKEQLQSEIKTDEKAQAEKLVTTVEEKPKEAGSLKIELPTHTENQEKPKSLSISTFENASLASQFPDVIAISVPMVDKVSYPGDKTLEGILNKTATKGIESLGVDELRTLHNIISNTAASILRKLGNYSVVLGPTECRKLELLGKIASLEGDLIRKQERAHEKISVMQQAIKTEKVRLADLGRQLGKERVNTLAPSKIKEEKQRVLTSKLHQEQQMADYIDFIEKEQLTVRALKDELKKQKANTIRMRGLREKELALTRSDKKDRKSTDQVQKARKRNVTEKTQKDDSCYCVGPLDREKQKPRMKKLQNVQFFED